jgi:hypothetical protein
MSMSLDAFRDEIAFGGKQMLVRAVGLLTCASLGLPIASAALAGFDIPGDGTVTCPDGCPPLSVGTVTSSGGLVSGILTAGGSSLGLTVAQDPVFLLFSGGTPGIFINSDGTPQNVTGPLGRNPDFTPVDPQDTTRPISGQALSLTITNEGSTLLKDIAFYVLADAALFGGTFTPQSDGLTFGLFCEGVQSTTECDATNLALLGPPSGTAGSIDPADLSSSTATFGDLLRFRNVNLAPSQAGTFSFFVTDYKGTRQKDTSGDDASQSLALAVVPTAETEVIPEPGTLVSMITGAACIALLHRRRRT